MNHAGEAQFDGFPVDTLTGVGELAGATFPPLRSLAIVGSHPATRELAPYDDKNFDIWLFNESPQKPEVYRRWDACLQLHLPEVYSSTENWVNKDHWNWLQQDHGNKVIWMQDVDPRVPNSARYPIEGVLSLVPYKYIRSSPAYALALAIYLGYDHIQLYGSELSSNTEYTYQAINYAFWIGFAHGKGINLEMKCWHNEFYGQPLYGYEGELQLDNAYFEKRMEYLGKQAKAKRSAYEKVKNDFETALQEAKFQKAADLSITAETLAKSTGEIEAALAEAERYRDRTNPISRQEFERVSAKAQRDGPDAEYEVAKQAGICEYTWNAWSQTGRFEGLQQFRHFVRKKLDAAYEAGKLSGIFVENMEYMREYDLKVTAAGGVRAVHQVMGDGSKN